MLIKAEQATEQAKGESEGGSLTHVCSAAGATRMNATEVLSQFLPFNLPKMLGDGLLPPPIVHVVFLIQVTLIRVMSMAITTLTAAKGWP